MSLFTKIRKKITAICAITILIASHQSHAMFTNIIKGVGTIGTIGLLTAIQSKYAPTKPVIYKNFNKTLLPEAFMTIPSTSQYPSEQSVQFALPETIDMIWKISTAEKRIQKKHPRAPKNVQKFVWYLAKKASTPYSLSSFMQRWFLRLTGKLIVYDGPDFSCPNFFKKNPNALAYANTFGIFFPKNSFNKNEISPFLKFLLAHEYIHIKRNDIINKKNSTAEKEYCTNRQALRLLYKIKDFDSLSDGIISQILGRSEAYYFLGAQDEFLNIIKKNPNDETIKLLKNNFLNVAKKCKNYYKNNITKLINQKDKLILQEEKSKIINEIQIDKLVVKRINIIISVFSNPEKYKVPTIKKRLKDFQNNK
ncbi:hypothetical protein KAH94_06085 [bacterium]|nr:hypothetical protein [bacterium]